MKTEQFYHYPDEIIFHGGPDSRGTLFLDCRAISNDDDKLSKLKERLTGYYINGLKDISHPFIMAIMTCVGIEVLGQVILGFDNYGETIRENTIKVYEMLSIEMATPVSTTFITNYNNRRNTNTSFPSYAHVIRKGLRNTLTHNYRSLGVFLDDTQERFMIVNEIVGCVVIHPHLFRERFIECFENSFNEIITNSNDDYRVNALRYFNWLIR
jgi:hypothetical protein